MNSRPLTALLLFLFVVGMQSAQGQTRIGSATVTAPAGWTEKSRRSDLVELQSSDGKEWATLSLLEFGTTPSFEDFKRLCTHRLNAENKASSGGFMQADAPTNNQGKFEMIFFGGEKALGRVYSGYLSLARRELVTIYVEGIGIDPAQHVATFQALAKSLERSK